MSSGEKNLIVYLWQNDNRLVYVYPGTAYNEGTVNMVLNMKSGDRVYVKCGGSGIEYIHTFWISHTCNLIDCLSYDEILLLFISKKRLNFAIVTYNYVSISTVFVFIILTVLLVY